MREVGEACRKHEHPHMLPKVARWLPRTWCEGRMDIHTFRHEPFDSSGYAGSALWKLSWQLEAKGTKVGEGTETHGTTASMRVQLPQWTRGIPGSCAQSSDRGSRPALCVHAASSVWFPGPAFKFRVTCEPEFRPSLA